MSTPEPSETDGQVIGGRYRLEVPIGRGGFGVVWRGRDMVLGRTVAVKQIQIPPQLSDEERQHLQRKVLREARLAARLSHPNAVTVFDVIEEEGTPYIVMELIEAVSLAELVEERGPLPPERCAEIGLELLDVLQAAHGQGIIHRDIKPGNVLVPAAGPARLADFGIASIVDEPSMTSSGLVRGSPSYMSPEQAKGEQVGLPTDLWSLGATLYFAVEGQAPFDKGGPVATMVAVCESPPRPPGRAGDLTALLLHLMSREPAQRPAAAQVADALRRVARPWAEPGPAGPGGAEPGGEPRAGGTGGPDETAVLLLAGMAGSDLTAQLPPVHGPIDLPAGTRTTARPPAPATPVAASRPAPEPVPPDPVPEPAPAATWAAAAAIPLATVADPIANPSPPAVIPVPPAPAPAPWQAPPERIPPAPARQRGILIAAAVAIALVAGLGLVVFLSRGKAKTTAPPPAPATPRPPAAAVPAGWVPYTDPATGFTISHPPGWQIITSGTRTDFRDPATGTYLRVDHVQPPGPSAVAAWRDEERSFAAVHTGYHRIQLQAATFQGFPAANWEFDYTEGSSLLHAFDLGFITGRYGFALYFQSNDSEWRSLQPTFQAFKASFKAPA